MPCKKTKVKANPGKELRKHTPITSEKQRRCFGAEYGRRKAGESTETDISTKDLRSHLKEVSGKNLPETAKKKVTTKHPRKKVSKKK